jgi:hypothetical protein
MINNWSPRLEPLGVVETGNPLHFTIGAGISWQLWAFGPDYTIDDAEEALREIGDNAASSNVTGFESYVRWQGLEPNEGQWDFSWYDMIDTTCADYNLPWVPFMVAGPAYATPMWFKESEESVFFKCLKDANEDRNQSVWNPNLENRYDTFFDSFADHFDHSKMQTVLLGISADYGEAGYPMGGLDWIYDPNWTIGEFHGHEGWWCNDDYAIEDFRGEMQQKYGDIVLLNAMWGEDFNDFNDITPFIPNNIGDSRRKRLDMAGWYKQSITDHTEMWLQTARRHLWDVPIQVMTGGWWLEMGLDSFRLSALAADYGCGVRGPDGHHSASSAPPPPISNVYPYSFARGRPIVTTCRNLGTYIGFEAPGRTDDPNHVVSRIYNWLTSGVDEHYEYDNVPGQGWRSFAYQQYLHLMTKKPPPEVSVAFFLPQTSQKLTITHNFLDGGAGSFYSNVESFRDYGYFDMLDESLIAKGLLRRYKALIWIEGKANPQQGKTGYVTESETLEQIELWIIEQGGLLFCHVSPEDVEGNSWEQRLERHSTVYMTDPNSTLDYFYNGILSTVPELFPDANDDDVYLTTFKDGSSIILDTSQGDYEIISLKPGQSY